MARHESWIERLFASLGLIITSKTSRCMYEIVQAIASLDTRIRCLQSKGSAHQNLHAVTSHAQQPQNTKRQDLYVCSCISKLFQAVIGVALVECLFCPNPNPVWLTQLASSELDAGPSECPTPLQVFLPPQRVVAPAPAPAPALPPWVRAQVP